MKIIVDKVFQSPSTPVIELAYFVRIFDYDEENSEEDENLVKTLEYLYNKILSEKLKNA